MEDEPDELLEEDEPDEASRAPLPPGRPTRITPFVIAQSAGIVSADGAHLPADEVARRVLQLTRLRLDRRNIADMDGLECCEAATHVYLQHNVIAEIDGLQFFSALAFLSLDHNRIRALENLRHLAALRYLGVAHNLIERAEVAELPSGLKFLDLYSNPCALREGYRQQLLNGLPGLVELDQIEVERDDWPELDAPAATGAPHSAAAKPPVAASDDASCEDDALQRLTSATADMHISQLRAGSTDVAAAVRGVRDKKAEILARARERRSVMRDLKHIAP